MSFQGVDVRATTDRLLFRTLLLDSVGAKVTGGTTALRLYELQTDGTLTSYDFVDNTFKATALTTPTLAMTHRTGNNSTFSTGVWTANLTTLSGFTAGSIYFAGVNNTGASPPDQVREFQFGNAEGDLVVNAARLNVDATAISTSTAAADRLEAALSTATGIDVNLDYALDLTPTVDTVGDALFNAARSLPNGDVPGAALGLARVSDLASGGSGSLRLVNTVMQASSTTLSLIALAADLPTGDTNDIYNNLTVVATDVSADNKPNIRYVSDYVASTNTFELDSALDFTPEVGVDTFEIWAIAASAVSGTFLTELQKVTTGFSATNPDNLISHLRAVMSKAASNPSGVGTYLASTDSLEAEAERSVLGQGSGFLTSTDSLQAIRDAIDTLVAPAVVTSTSLSGSGFISDTVGLIRRAVDEPSTSPKYTNADILEFVAGAYDVVMADININTDHPIVVRADLSITAGKQTYNLPPHVAQVYRIAKINSTTGLPEYEVWPGTEFSFTGRGWVLEGNTIRFLSDWETTVTLQILFMPNTETFMHKGTIASGSVATDVTATTLKFASTVTDGTLDTRPNCYAGYLLRLLSSSTGLVEERIITAYANTTRIATINEAWDSTPGAGTAVVYEVIPQFSRLIRHVVCLRAAIDILAQEGNQKRMQTLGVSYQVKLNALRRYLSSKQARFPHSANGDTVDNSNRGFWGGEVL